MIIGGARMGNDENQKYAWEIELEQYRSKKKLNRFLIAGAVCGFLSLGISLYILAHLI
jgi:hypothetical protein